MFPKRNISLQQYWGRCGHHQFLLPHFFWSTAFRLWYWLVWNRFSLHCCLSRNRDFWAGLLITTIFAPRHLPCPATTVIVVLIGSSNTCVCVCVWSENRLCLIVNVCFHPKLKNKSFLTSTDLQKFNQINRILTSSLCTRTPLPLLLLPPKSAPFPKFAKEMQSLIKILRSRLISPLKTPIQKPIELFSTFKTRSFLS